MMLIRLAWRSLWRHTRRTVLTIFAISMGLALGLFFIALGEGQYDRLIADAVRIQAGHVTIEHPEYVKAPAADLFITGADQLTARLTGLEHVQVIRPMVLASGIATTAHGAQGIQIFGVDPAIERTMSPLADPAHLQGRYLADTDEPMAIIGSTLAEQLEIGLGKKLVLTVSAATNGSDGSISQTLVRVAGIFTSGSDEIDGHLVQIPINTARRLLRLPDDAVHRLGVILTRNDAVEETLVAAREAASASEGPAAALPWPEVMPELWSFMQVDQGGNWVMQGILMGLILFIIFNTLYMSVMERQREFAVMASLGTPPGRIRAQVMVESLLIGLLSAVAGLSFGGAVCEYFRQVGLDLSQLMEEGMTISGFFMDPVMRPYASWGLMLRLGLVVVISTVVMGLLPARRATRVNIVETLRSGA